MNEEKKIEKIEKEEEYSDITTKEWEKVLEGIYSKHKKTYIFTQNYHMRNELADIAFDTRFNKKKELQDLFDDKHNYTITFFRSLRHQAKNNDHIILVISGPTNSSKSWSTISIAYSIKEMFYDIYKNDSKILLSFSDDEYSELLPEMREKDVMIRDETPNVTGEGSMTLQKNLKNVIAITRAGQYCFLFVSPDRTVPKSNVVSFYLESAGLNKEKEEARFIIYDNELNALGRIFIKKPTDEKFLKKYEIKKKQNINEIIEDAGLVEVSVNRPKQKEQIQLLAKFCFDRGVKFKGEIKSTIIPFNEKYPKNKIVGTPGYIEDIKNLTFQKIKKIKEGNFKGEVEERKRFKSKIYSEAKDFTFDDSKIDDIIREENQKGKSERTYPKRRNIDQDLEIFHKLQNSNDLSQYKLAEEYGFSEQNLSILLNGKDGIVGKYSHYRGKEFETQFYDYLIEKYKNVDDIQIKSKGGIGEPDIYMFSKKKSELVVLSLKIFSFPKKTYRYPLRIQWKSYKKKEKKIKGFTPEIIFAGGNLNDFEKINVYVVICNANTGKVKTFPFNVCDKKSIRIEKEF